MSYRVDISIISISSYSIISYHITQHTLTNGSENITFLYFYMNLSLYLNKGSYSSKGSLNLFNISNKIDLGLNEGEGDGQDVAGLLYKELR